MGLSSYYKTNNFLEKMLAHFTRSYFLFLKNFSESSKRKCKEDIYNLRSEKVVIRPFCLCLDLPRNISSNVKPLRRR